MDEAKHTPGPWIYDPNDREDLIVKQGGNIVCVIDDNRAFTLQQCQANAKLIAAAPDLLDVAMKVYQDYQTNNSTIGKSIRLLLEVAIDKATK